MNIWKRISQHPPLLIAALIIAFGAIGLFLAFVLPKKYQANSMLLFSEPGTMHQGTGRAIRSPFGDDMVGPVLYGQIPIPTVGTKPDAIIDIIESRAAAEAMVAKHGARLFKRQATDDDLRDFTDAIRFQVTETGQLRLGFVHRDRQVALDVLKDLVAFAEDRARDLSRQFADESIEFLEAEVAERQRKVAERTEQLRQALTSSPLAIVAGDRDRFVAELVNASMAVQNLGIDMRAADASLDVTLNAIRHALQDGIDGEAYTEATERLRHQILDLQAKMELASKTIAGDSPEMQRISSSFDATATAYVNELKRIAEAAENRSLNMTLGAEASRAALAERLSGMRSRLSQLREDNLELVDLQLEQRELTGSLSRAEKEHENALSQLNAAKLAQKKTYAPFVILDPPYAPEKHVFPRKGIFTLGGMGFGFFIGMFLYVRRTSLELQKSPEHEKLAA